MRDLTGLTAGSLLLLVSAQWVAGGGITTLGSLAGALTSLGRVTGLIASALLLLQVLLMARIPVVEQAWGQDELARFHRYVGFTSFSLVWAHIVLITLGYAASSPAGLWGTIVDLVLHYPGMLLAVAGTIALCLVVVTSIKVARAKVRYESWHLLHLYAYLGAGLALPHQLWTGQEFAGHRLLTVLWWGLWAASVIAMVIWRIAVPLWRSLRAPMFVESVRPVDGERAVTVTVAGPGVARLRVGGGQFFNWRFAQGVGWTRANPYSLSMAPDGRSLSFTAAIVGDGSARLTRLRPGARVFIEGPYGRMHPGVRTRPKVLLMGGGIGVTPVKALLEALPQAPGEVTLIHRVSHPEDSLLRDEITQSAQLRGAEYVRVAGHRVRSRSSWLPQQAEHYGEAAALREICPDVHEREVFICGAPAWVEAAHAACRDAGVPAQFIHAERFAY